MPEGLTLLCGRPKVGKSWGGSMSGSRSLRAASALAAGKQSVAMCSMPRSKIIGDACNVVSTSYFRLSRRIGRTDARHLGAGSTRAGCSTSPNGSRRRTTPRLVILDTLAGVKPIRKNSGYAEDYESLTNFHRLANDTGIGILVLHHTRKLDAEDPLDTISGTLGLAGCADTAWSSSAPPRA